MDCRQSAATREGRFPYARHAVRDGHGRQATATIESTITYARHTVRNGNGRQAVATGEGCFPYARTSRDDNLFQRSRNRAPEYVTEVCVESPFL